MNDKPKVKIASCVSNEAPYLPQWVHYHFWHGVSAIDLYVNRTTDNTISVIKKLQKYYPRLNWYSCDWIDRCFGKNPINGLHLKLCNNHSYANCEDDIDYLLCIDIDEFWTALDCHHSIGDSLVKLGYPDAVIFEWFLIRGQIEYIFPLHANRSLYGCWGWYTKALVKTGLEVYIDIHTVWGQLDKIVNADGTIYKRTNNIYAVHPEQHGFMKPYFVLHDSVRSMANNFSKFVRACVQDAVDNVKTVFNSKRGMFKTRYTDEIIITNNLPGEYYRSYYQMCASLDLFAEIKEGRIYELLYALEFLRIISSFKDEPFTKMVIKSLGSIESLHELLIEQLCAIDNSYKSDVDIGLSSCESLLRGDKTSVVKNLLSAIKLYPFAMDDRGEPLFIKTLLDYLLKSCDIDYTKMIITEHQLLMRKNFQRPISNYLRKQIINRIFQA